MIPINRRKANSPSGRAAKIALQLRQSIPDVRIELAHRSPWELLVATILSAQCTDRRVNQVTPALFKRYPTPQSMAMSEKADLEALIKPTGFYKSKAKNLVGCAQAVSTRFGGHVPHTMDELTSIPGVGRKTANVILGGVFGKPGVVVDTHVKRMANRLALSRSQNPEQIERDIQALYPQSDWTDISQRLLLHWRYVCLARKPRCHACLLSDVCKWEGKLTR
ncbi:MAG TPA: endonuclease III [Nitrospira sp.]|nr:endonuclease III [Nitrospira sp.]